ncbi:MAG TPA: DUF2249 domain-containing protein [Verrucomicrobiae bacterium]
MKVNSAAAEISPDLCPNSLPALEFDIRSIFAAGQSPCGLIDETVARLKPGQDFVLLAPFEPIPLFTKLAGLGFEHSSEKLPDGTWRISFTRN